MSDVRSDEIGTKVKFVSQVGGIVLAGVLNQFGGQRISNVHLSVIVHSRFGVQITDGQVTNSIQANVFLVPVARVPRDFNMVVETPGLEKESSVANEIFGLGPSGETVSDLPVFEYGVSWDRIPSVMFGDWPSSGLVPIGNATMSRLIP